MQQLRPASLNTDYFRSFYLKKSLQFECKCWQINVLYDKLTFLRVEEGAQYHSQWRKTYFVQKIYWDCECSFLKKDPKVAKAFLLPI